MMYITLIDLKFKINFVEVMVFDQGLVFFNDNNVLKLVCCIILQIVSIRHQKG